MKKNKKEFIISVIAIVIIVLFVLGATYAYFQAQTGEGASTDINITSSTVDSLTFSTGNAISLSATQSNFGTGEASLSGSTTASATLVANNSTNYAEATYYLYVKISSNDFTYTTSDSTPELILSITGPDGEVSSLSGLTYTTVEDNQGTSYSGFDITTESGLISVAELYEIVSSGTEIDEWTITVTFINLSTDQSANAGSSFSAEVIIQQEGMTFSSYIISLAGAENNLYYHAEDISQDTTGSAGYACYYDGLEVYGGYSYSISDVTESTCQTVYKMSSLSGGTYYFDSTLSSMLSLTSSSSVRWDDETNTCVADSLSGTYYLFNLNFDTPTEDECVGGAYQTLIDGYQEYYIVTEITSVGSGEWLEYYTLGAQDNSYRYSGASDEVNNFVCFGSNADICPYESLYRIIGVFQKESGEYQVKLIKADYADNDLLGTDGGYGTGGASDASEYEESYLGSKSYFYWYDWNKNSLSLNGYYNLWSLSTLNTVNLNTNYLSNIGTKWSDMISTTTWIIGGLSDLPSSAKELYNNEIVKPSNETGETEYDAKVGLMYLSDYAYASSSDYWDIGFYSDSWVYLGVYEWTLTRFASTVSSVYVIDESKFISYTSNGNYRTVRPCFYLSSDVLIESGSGTYESPYRISL